MSSLYNQEYYEKHLGPIPCSWDSEDWVNLAKHFAKEIVKGYNPSTVIDVGCSLGLLVKAFLDLGVDAIGFDASQYAIKVAIEQGLKNKVFQLPLQVIGTVIQDSNWIAEVVVCIEVLEHIEEDWVDLCVKNICLLSAQYVIFSSSPNDFEEPTHVNVQPEEYWVEKFKKNGFVVVNKAEYITPWALVFKKL